MQRHGSGLLVAEYSGTARSGKGTIVEHLTKKYSYVTSDEGGADYRALTKALLLNNTITVDTVRSEVARRVTHTNFGLLTGLVADRQTIIDTYGLASLYESDVDGLVSVVAALPEVRRAVKAGFCKRIEAVRDSNKYTVLAIDGRNLADFVKDIPGTRLFLRTFTICSAEEAALRECARNNIPFDSPAGRAVLKRLRRRNQEDEQRPIDPVIPDLDAIDYWQYTASLDSAKTPIGALAARQQRQIHFSTDPYRRIPDPVTAMLKDADQMFEDALQALG